MRAGFLFSAFASASLAAGLNAQGTPAKPDSSCTKFSDGRVECRVYRYGPRDSSVRNLMFYRTDSALANRAALGLELRATGSTRDTLGVFVESVTPKGPAELAGIVEGDRIASINGVDVRTPAVDAEDELANQIASRRLSREVRKLIPGARVNLRVYSGGRFRDVQVTAGKASEVMRLSSQFGRWMPMGGMEFDAPRMMMMLGPGERMREPEMQKLREEMPMMKERIEPMMLKQQLEPQMRKRIELSPLVRQRTIHL